MIGVESSPLSCAALSQQLEDAVLASPGGVSKMMDLLSDSREIVRNGQCAHLLLLTSEGSHKFIHREPASFDRSDQDEPGDSEDCGL